MIMLLTAFMNELLVQELEKLKLRVPMIQNMLQHTAAKIKDWTTGVALFH